MFHNPKNFLICSRKFHMWNNADNNLDMQILNI